jgi:hypothetical protein
MSSNVPVMGLSAAGIGTSTTSHDPRRRGHLLIIVDPGRGWPRAVKPKAPSHCIHNGHLLCAMEHSTMPLKPKVRS